VGANLQIISKEFPLLNKTQVCDLSLYNFFSLPTIELSSKSEGNGVYSLTATVEDGHNDPFKDGSIKWFLYPKNSGQLQTNGRQATFTSGSGMKTDNVTVFFSGYGGNIGETGRQFVQTKISLASSCSFPKLGDLCGGGVVVYIDETGQHGLIAASLDVISPATGSQIVWANFLGRKFPSGLYEYSPLFGVTVFSPIPASLAWWIENVNKSDPYFGGTPWILEALGTGDGIGAGARNTAIIAAALPGAAGDFDPAAKLAADFNVQADGLTPCTRQAVCYDDWYLPSKYELNLMYSRLVHYDYGLGAINYFSFSFKLPFYEGGFYWSSTENGAGEAWAQSFITGEQVSVSKFKGYGESGFVLFARPIRAF
jgi:hypothetical protein